MKKKLIRRKCKLYGDTSGIYGNIDECGVEEKREKGINIKDLIH